MLDSKYSESSINVCSFFLFSRDYLHVIVLFLLIMQMCRLKLSDEYELGSFQGFVFVRFNDGFEYITHTLQEVAKKVLKQRKSPKQVGKCHQKENYLKCNRFHLMTILNTGVALLIYRLCHIYCAKNCDFEIHQALIKKRHFDLWNLLYFE